MSAFSKRLKELRNERKLTQAEFAAAINKSRATVAGYETDDRFPDIDTLSKIADYFDEDTDWILGRTDVRSKVLGFAEKPLSREAYKVLADTGLAELIPNSRNELIVNMTEETVRNLFDDPQTRLNFMNSCLDRTLDLFSLPQSAKEDLANAILSIAIKHSAFIPPKEG